MRILRLKKNVNGKRIYWSNFWLSFYPGFHKLSFTVSPAGYFDDRPRVNFSLGWGKIYTQLPFFRSKKYTDECDPPRYGFYFYGEGLWFPDTFVICKGDKTKHIYLPWAYDWVRTSLMLKDGTWEHDSKKDRKSFYKDEWNDKKWSETHPYKYTLNNGTVQERLATIGVTQWEWRPRWFKWTALFQMVRTSIDIEFSDEVGERTGSWKGGTIGCSYTLMPNETPYECLKRMEGERKF